MALHFETAEFASRLTRLTDQMRAEKLDAVLLFAQESMYWLTGYDAFFGYCFFQTLVVKADGTMSLITRSGEEAPSSGQARVRSLKTSTSGSTASMPTRRSTSGTCWSIWTCWVRASASNTTPTA